MKQQPAWQPFGKPTSLPVLEVTQNGKTEMLVQSKAILRYIGSIGSYQGKKALSR